MIEYKHPPLKYTPKFGDKEICKIADAAVETFRQGSVDLFMDCPSRERAGWLCDSFFREERNTCFAVKLLLNMTFWKISFVKKNMLTFPTV